MKRARRRLVTVLGTVVLAGAAGLALWWFRPWIAAVDWGSGPHGIAETRESAPGSTLRLYFGNSRRDPEMLDCGRVYPVERPAGEGGDVGTALQLLSRGPTPEEREAGYFSSLPDGSQLRLDRVEAGTAVVSLVLPPGMGLGGSCAVEAIRAQVEATLRQFPGIERVVVQLAGDQGPFLNP
ncbi:MAG: hypothetical protein Kow00109_17140 [Acidobacteriota bacterium]